MDNDKVSEYAKITEAYEELVDRAYLAISGGKAEKEEDRILSQVEDRDIYQVSVAEGGIWCSGRTWIYGEYEYFYCFIRWDNLEV